MIGAWLVLLSVGMVYLTLYQSRPGVMATPETVDAAAVLDALDDADGRRVVLFAHPHCPCTLATARALERVLERPDVDAACDVFFFEPADADPTWADGRLARFVAQLPRTTVHRDVEGEVALRFGAMTSGTVLVLDEGGDVLFTGGVTPQRGHEGVNSGAQSVLAHLQAAPGAQPTHPVFGCGLAAHDDCSEEVPCETPHLR